MRIHSNDIDVPKLRHVLEETATEIAAVKHALRQTWQRPMADEQQRLMALKDQASLLHILLAHLRHRLHVLKPIRRWWIKGQDDWDAEQYHRTLALRAADRYRLFSSARAAAAYWASQ